MSQDFGEDLKIVYDNKADEKKKRAHAPLKKVEDDEKTTPAVVDVDDENDEDYENAEHSDYSTSSSTTESHSDDSRKKHRKNKHRGGDGSGSDSEISLKKKKKHRKSKTDDSDSGHSQRKRKHNSRHASESSSSSDVSEISMDSTRAKKYGTRSAKATKKTPRDEEESDSFVATDAHKSAELQVTDRVPVLFKDDKSAAAHIARKADWSREDFELTHPEHGGLQKSRNGYTVHSVTYYKKGKHTAKEMKEREADLTDAFYERMLPDIERILEEAKERGNGMDDFLVVPPSDRFEVRVHHHVYIYSKEDFDALVQQSGGVTLENLENHQYTKLEIPFAYYTPRKVTK
jgi:hypothetical protein